MASGRNPQSRQNAGFDQTRIGLQAPIIGEPMTFATGQFAGRTIRVELEELQKAESGRKYAKVDRRPLDPPPAVLLRLFETDPQSGEWERELLYEDVYNVGLMCTVDLFPVPESFYDARSATSQSPEPSSSHDRDSSGRHHLYQPLTYFPLHPYMSMEASGSSQTPMMPFQIPRRQPMLANVHSSDPPNDVAIRIGNHLVTESSKLTPALVGEKFAEPTLIDHRGKKCLVFVFGDLAVRREGVFILRYRAFDIFSGINGSPPSPVLAELYGGPFKVYSTREFPGLEPSTELTKNLSKYGVRVTLRDAERKSKKRSKSDE
ncbi:putative velvet family sexual development regulator [Psilocybe cubensis]|uniref:Velvet family sexual development regulator n=2 Tax=Psilocybe cubensis TaxID=181762 RepID=A0ACB8HB43_PSICU|nr:putative velvet family sexual development regulator [Psilocybe cubensis]KAH9485023.1 putative velvet family sexual development regulator [Psilocybe cubensis]